MIMLSKQVAKTKLGAEDGFVWRGKEVSRVEGLSDAVFAFSVTLLIVSTEVPKTYDALIERLFDFIPFAACFLQLMVVWYTQYKFYRRYNLEDAVTTRLTIALLFVVLFYTYPLKFVFMSWFTTFRPSSEYLILNGSQMAGLFTIYGVGFIAVFLIFFLMYRHAYRKREELELTETEVWDTRHSMREIILFCGVAALSVIVANVVPPDISWLGGPVYSLIGLVSWAHERWSGKRRKEIYSQSLLANV